MMASLTERNLQNAMTCLLDRDAEMCAVTMADEEEIDALEKSIDQDGIEMLLRFQPVASDLRQIVSTMKVGAIWSGWPTRRSRLRERSRKLSMEPRAR